MDNTNAHSIKWLIMNYYEKCDARDTSDICTKENKYVKSVVRFFFFGRDIHALYSVRGDARAACDAGRKRLGPAQRDGRWRGLRTVFGSSRPSGRC